MISWAEAMGRPQQRSSSITAIHCEEKAVGNKIRGLPAYAHREIPSD